MEPSSFSSLFNLPYSKDINYFSQTRHIAHPTTQCIHSKKHLFREHNDLRRYREVTSISQRQLSLNSSILLVNYLEFVVCYS